MNMKFCGSKVLIHKQANHSFWGFNDGREIMSYRNGKLLVYGIAEKHKKRLAQRFETKRDM